MTHARSFAYIQDRCYHAIQRALFPPLTQELRRDAKRFQRACKATSEAIRSELAASSNVTLEQALSSIRNEQTDGLGRVG